MFLALFNLDGHSSITNDPIGLYPQFVHPALNVGDNLDSWQVDIK